MSINRFYVNLKKIIKLKKRHDYQLYMDLMKMNTFRIRYKVYLNSVNSNLKRIN